jgi:hypothetical protein
VDIEGIVGGIFLLTIGILVIVPLPLDGGFIWLPPDPTITAIVLAVASLLIIVGTFLIVAGFRSTKKSQPRKVAGATCLLLSFFILFAGFIAESEFWAGVSLALGVGFLVAGVFLVGIRETTKKTKSAR